MIREFVINPQQNPATKMQMATYVLCGILTLATVILWARVLVEISRFSRAHGAGSGPQTAQVQQAQAQAAQAKPALSAQQVAPLVAAQPQAQVQQPQTAMPVQTQAAAPMLAAPVDPAAHYEGDFGSEVQEVTRQWKETGFGRWQPIALDPGSMMEYPSAKMAELEAAKAGDWRAAAATHWQGQHEVPVLAGTYDIERAVVSNWPAPGSLALELTPTEADPAGKAGPWRVVLFVATDAEASREAEINVAAMASLAPETVQLGRGSVPAVPVERQRLGTDGKTFYAVIPAAAARMSIRGRTIAQVVNAPPAQVAQATAAPTAQLPNRHAAWQELHDAYVQQIRARLAAATTDAQKGQIQADIARWKSANPEPPQSGN